MLASVAGLARSLYCSVAMSYRAIGLSLCVFFFVCVCVCVLFFFQAEDGIRDLVRSRGLGDVYKRQGLEQNCLS